MNSDTITSQNYLDELYKITDGDSMAQVSMHDVGARIGLDKAESGKIAEQLMVQGQIELKTLAGGITITEDGLATLGVTAPVKAQPGQALILSNSTVLSEKDRTTVQQLSRLTKDALSGLQADYDLIEEIVIDLKTLETQLLSPQPKTAIIKEIFRSIHNGLHPVLQKDSQLIARLTEIV